MIITLAFDIHSFLVERNTIVQGWHTTVLVHLQLHTYISHGKCGNTTHILIWLHLFMSIVIVNHGSHANTMHIGPQYKHGVGSHKYIIILICNVSHECNWKHFKNTAGHPTATR